MAKGTKIEWADDTVNAEMGCDGCELWDPKNEVRICYAGLQTERMLSKGPLKGWPRTFDEPRARSRAWDHGQQPAPMDLAHEARGPATGVFVTAHIAAQRVGRREHHQPPGPAAPLSHADSRTDQVGLL